MNKIPSETIDRILDAADIVKEIGEDISLRKQGVNYTALCPFHAEKTPSFMVSPSKGICKCFSCGKGGNVIWYRMEHDGLTFPEAVRLLGRKYNVEVPSVELTPEQQQQNDDRASAMVVMSEAQALFTANLSATPEATAYLRNRQITPETASLYGVGFAYDYDGLTRTLEAKGFERRHILAAGLGYMDEEKQRLKDTFWQRILFPFYSKTGQVIGYTGRAINDQRAKYKNTGDTILFHKGSHIFGLYQARQAIQQEDLVYIVEGQFDVLSLAQAGIRNVVGGSGTAFTDQQRRLLHGMTGNVVFIYDGDAAGVAAAEKNLMPFVKDEFRVRCILLPDGKDPDDMARTPGIDLPRFLKKSTHTYIRFLCATLMKDDDDEYTRVDKVKKILAIVALEHETAIRDKLLTQLFEATGMDLPTLRSMLDETHLPPQPERFEEGFYGLDFVGDYIDPEERELHLVGDFDRFQHLAGERQPYIYYHGLPTKIRIQELAKMADRFIFHSPLMECNERRENSDVLLMKEMFKYGLTIDVVQNEKTLSFVYAYIGYYSEAILECGQAADVRNEFITRCAEMISYCKPAVQVVNLPKWADLLHVKANALKEVVKPFVQERKSQKRMESEREDVYGDLMAIDTDSVPSYVEENEEYSKMLRRYGFYPLLNKEGTPVCYMFRTESNAYRRVGDFYIEPLFHVYSSQKEENRRVIRINRLYVNKPTYVEWPSSVFVKLTSLQEMLINEGAYNFENGDARDYQKIWNCISYHFPKCTEIKVYGQQEEGCFIFANGIYHQVEGEWRFEYSDELGLMRHGDDIFYSPSFSKINIGQRRDNDRYEQDRWLSYTEVPEGRRISFAEWASLMDRVYQVNDNGKWATLYAVMCAFRSDIHPINRLFTSIFFIGPTMSGKTQIAISIRSLFIKPDAPSFNLNSGTDAAFFSVLERFRDVPQVFEEYNDEMISDNKFQGLKSVTYDGDGKQKRKAATGNDIETSKVNAPVVLLGQEAPQKDDNALTNRVVLCEVPKREDINSEQAQQIFQTLKQHEKEGLSYLLLQVLALRPLVRQHFARLQKECSRQLQQRVESGGQRSGDQARVVNTVSMFLAMCRLMELYAPQLRLPFSYDQFLDLAADKVRKQVEMIVKTDKLAVFFNAIDYLIDKGSIRPGRDFKIERPGTVRLKNGTERHLQPADTPVLYMNLGNIHKMYEATMSGGERPLSLTTLDINLKSHPSYIGQVSSTRFRWMEAKEVPAAEITVDAQYQFTNTGSKTGMMMTRIMERREKNTSAVVLRYDTLSRMMGIDFERAERTESMQPDTTQSTQNELPF